MKYLTERDLIKLAEKQNKLTDELKTLIAKYHARYRLRIIAEAELFTLLNLKNNMPTWKRNSLIVMVNLLLLLTHLVKAAVGKK